jgi:hypothetical protein
MRTWILAWCAAALAVVSSEQRSPAQTAKTGGGTAPAELVQQTTLSEVMRHLYRWYLDENDVERVANQPELVFWVRRVNAKLDPGDQSVFGEICMPQLDTTIELKKADYSIEETKTAVKSRNFRIKNVARAPLPASPAEDYQVVRVPMQEMKEYLFRTRNQPDFPDAALFERMRQALRKELEKEKASLGLTNALTGEQIVYLAPLSPVGNDAWVYWENQKLLIRFASDVDLSNPAVWEHETMRIQVYDAYRQMVISLEEAAASNRFMTRNQIGRALYNCIVLGQRVAVTPRPASGP